MSITLPPIPEDAPFTPEQRDWLETYLKQVATTLANGAPDPSLSLPRALLLFGSQSGNAESLAEGYAQTLKESGWNADAVSMENYSVVDLTKEPLVLVVTSTWGEGDPPDTAVDFWNALSSDAHPRLESLSYSVLALGDTNYADFCETGKRMDARFEELGASRLLPRVDCDVDYETLADEWFGGVISKLNELGKDRFTTSMSTSQESSATDTESAPEAIPYGKKNPFPSPLKVKYRLNLDPSPRDTRHLELDLEGSGLEYEVGDAVATYPLNDPDLVDEILSLLPFNTSKPVVTKDRGEIPLRDALLECFDIRTVTKAVLKKWAPYTCHPYLHAVLDDDEEVAKIIDGIEIIDLIYDFPAGFANGQEFVDLLRRLAPRLYSIASSPKKHPGEVHLTVAKVVYESKGRVRKGVCSTFLCEGMEEGDTVRVFMQPTKHFKLPEDLGKDIIMVGPGTGIAPFRAFLEEREVTEATGRNWLFFGNPHEATDYFYKDEFDAMQESGVLTRIDLAWSRDQDHKIYVQDKLRESAEEIWQWLENGAHFYVCGDAKYMAPDVEQALLDAISQYGGTDEEGARDYLKKMKDEHRYQRDVY